MVSKKTLRQLARDPQEVIDAEMARAARKLKIPEPKSDPAAIAQAVQKGALGPKREVVEILTRWRDEQLGRVSANGTSGADS